MQCAPILIPTLNRNEHFIRLIESLRINTWAKYTDVYIGLDYPPNASYEYGYGKICDYLNQEFPEFKSVVVFKREYNYGSAKNANDLINYAIERYDSFIRTDDDAEFSPNYLEYINKCLNFFETDSDIIAVSGYSYPISWKRSEGSTIIKENYSCPMWGTAFWTRKYKVIRESIESGCIAKNVSSVINGSEFNLMAQVAQCEYINLCLTSEYKGSLASYVSDVSLRMYMAIEKKFTIIPVISKVRNWGFDGTGEYCKDYKKRKGKLNAYNYPYHIQPLDENHDFSITEDTLQAIDQNRKLFNSFDVLPLSMRIISKIKLFLFKKVGKNMFLKIVRFVRRIKTK